MEKGARVGLGNRDGGDLNDHGIGGRKGVGVGLGMVVICRQKVSKAVVKNLVLGD